jgi:hypothetical protein
MSLICDEWIKQGETNAADYIKLEHGKYPHNKWWYCAAGKQPKRCDFDLQILQYFSPLLLLGWHLLFVLAGATPGIYLTGNIAKRHQRIKGTTSIPKKIDKKCAMSNLISTQLQTSSHWRGKGCQTLLLGERSPKWNLVLWHPSICNASPSKRQLVQKEIDSKDSGMPNARFREDFGITNCQPSNESTTQMSGGSILSFQHSSDSNSNNKASVESKESKEVSKDDYAYVASVTTDLGIATDLKEYGQKSGARHVLEFPDYPDYKMDEDSLAFYPLFPQTHCQRAVRNKRQSAGVRQLQSTVMQRKGGQGCKRWWRSSRTPCVQPKVLEERALQQQ